MFNYIFIDGIQMDIRLSNKKFKFNELYMFIYNFIFYKLYIVW
jgi:hypothetical protein